MAESVLADPTPRRLGVSGHIIVTEMKMSALAHDGDAHLGIANTCAAARERATSQLELETLPLHDALLVP